MCRKAGHWRFYNGEIPDEDVDVSMLAYTEDNLYDIVADAIGYLQVREPDPIPFKMKQDIRR